MAGNSAVPGQTVSEKLLRVLEAFAGERTALTMSEISRAANLPSSTAHRLIQELVEWGGLERISGGRYVVGLHLWEIATRAARAYDTREVVMPFLQGLWETTRAHVLLASLEGDHVLLIERIAGTRDVPPAGRAGGRLPLHASSAGKVLLAHAGEDLLAAVLAAGLPRYTPRTIVDSDRLARELARIRDAGVAVSDGELIEGTYSCAALVPGPPELGAMAVSLLSSSGARDAREMEVLVRMAAKGMGNGLSRRRPHIPISPSLRKVEDHP
ncbi:MAG: putative HTH-type transcriptional regulator yagI [Citricoccus sp.]|nr:putative HTH-type transcriptional regulator yagI [Citricoccus sp. WCRC_4]